MHYDIPDGFVPAHSNVVDLPLRSDAVDWELEQLDDTVAYCRNRPEKTLVSHCLNGCCAVSRTVKTTCPPTCCPLCGCSVENVEVTDER